RHLPDRAPLREPSFQLLKKGAIKPTPAEAARNPRARSARLRVAERTAAPAHPENGDGRAAA
ncbi:MAG: 16S rRNA (cytosine(1402)-N(4))-methyltransferase, partial [Rhodospirillales bacterium]